MQGNKEEVLKLYKEGLPLKEISKITGVSRQRIYELLKKEDVVTRSEIQDDLIKKFCTKEHPRTILEIADKLGMTYQGTLKLIKRLNLPIKQKENLKTKLASLDTKSMTFKELFNECKYLTSNEHSFRQALTRYNVKYKLYNEE